MTNSLIETERLCLRNWIDSDFKPFANMCGDSEVMKFFPRVQSEEETYEHIRKFQSHFEEHGFTYFAAELKSSHEFIGFVGLKNQTFESPFTPCIDIGWRLKKEAWGKGYATEAAFACVDFAFNQRDLADLYAFCPQVNLASQAVMKRIGMIEVGSFHHSSLPDGSDLNPCVAWKLSRQ